MRVISMVPSWSETLIEAKANLIGKTRYCIHPESSLQIVGGTKDWDLKLIKEIKPDLIILDKEENPKMMADEAPCSYFASSIERVEDIPHEILRLNEKLNLPNLKQQARDWENLIKRGPSSCWSLNMPLPGLIKWGREPKCEIKKIIYLIWRNPWMGINKETFIASSLKFSGIDIFGEYSDKYPIIDLDNEDKESTLLLFSSEPYPFLNKELEMMSLGFPHAFVDGESFSWFGIRSYRFLKSLK